MHTKTIAQLAAGLRNGDFSSEELTRAYLQRVARHDDTLNSFITVSEAEALQQARLADQRLKAGDGTTLTGIPVAQKDIFCTNGVLTTCGSRMLENFVAPYNATVIDKFKCNSYFGEKFR